MEKAGRDGPKDGRPDGRPGEGAAISPLSPSAPARRVGAGAGRGRRCGDNNPAARLWARRGEGGGGLARPRSAQRPGRGCVPAAVGSAGRAGGRGRGCPPTPPPRPLPARGAGFPGSPGRSWILLLAEAGSEFRSVIPGGVTSEKFFFSAEILAGAGKLLQNSGPEEQRAPQPPPGRRPSPPREAAPHPPAPGRFGWSRGD